MVLPLVIAAAALQGYGQGKKSKFLLDREDEAIAKQYKFEADQNELERNAQLKVAKLEAEEKDLTRLLERYDDLEKNSLPGTFASIEDIATLTGNERNLNFWGVRKITGGSIEDKTAQATAFFTTKSPFQGSQNAYIADLMNMQSEDPTVLITKKRAVDGFWSAYANTLGGIIREEEYPQSNLIMPQTEGTAKEQKTQDIPSISSLISGPLKKTYDQLKTVEAKREFATRLNDALTSAYRIEVEGTKYAIDPETLPNPLSDEPDQEIKLSAEAPKVQTEPDKNYTFDVDALDVVLSHAAKNPRTDPTVTAYINEKGDFINEDGSKADGSQYKAIVAQTREDVQTIANYANRGILVHDGDSPYISGSSEDQLKYDEIISRIVSRFGVGEAANILAVAVPEGFGNRIATANIRKNESREEFERRVALPRVGLTSKPRSYYEEAFANLDRAQIGILDALGLLKDGKPIVGFTGALYTKAYAIFSDGGQVNQLFDLMTLFSATPDDRRDLGTYSEQQREETNNRLTSGRDAFNSYRKRIEGAEGAEKQKLMREMYEDTVILRYLQVEIVYNIARTLENPDGSGARLSRTDIDQMMQGTQLGNMLQTRDGVIAMLTYLQSRNNNRYQISKYLKNPSNYNNPKKRAALQMIEGSTRIEDKFINNGRHLSSGTDTDGKPLAIKDMESIVFTAVTRGTEEFNRRDSTLQLDPLRTKDPNFFEKVGDFFSGGQDYSTLDATEEALKD